MKVTITGQHIEVTPAIRGHVEEKIGRIKRHFEHPLDINVVLPVEKIKHNA
ncbi:MAG: ribosome-associated translation inhibitor RaiA, partial [Ferrovum sp.]|nr:ribosome-associated translation inhibitor RaiA [Ferrovum sp.]